MAAVMGLRTGRGDRRPVWPRSERRAAARCVSRQTSTVPAQTAISGDADAVERPPVTKRARRPEPSAPWRSTISAPFHCELMAPAAAKLALELDRAFPFSGIRRRPWSATWRPGTCAAMAARRGRAARAAGDGAGALHRDGRSPWPSPGASIAMLEIGPGPRAQWDLVARIDAQASSVRTSSSFE